MTRTNLLILISQKVRKRIEEIFGWMKNDDDNEEKRGLSSRFFNGLLGFSDQNVDKKISSWRNSMLQKNFFRLQHREAVVAEMASRLLAAYITASQVNQSNEEEMIEKSLSFAARLAQKADKLIESDDKKGDA